jgi:hypothetical protein
MKPGTKPSVRYWKSKQAYGCSLAHEQHILARGPEDGPDGTTYLKALDHFRKLVAKDDSIGTDNYLVSSLLNQYRSHLNSTRKSGTPGVFEVMARRFTEKFGSQKVGELKPYAFDAWLNEQATWNSTTKAHAIALILGAINWAARKGFAASNPLLGKIERHTPVLRGPGPNTVRHKICAVVSVCLEI